MDVQAKEHVDKCCQHIMFKVKQQKTPVESIVETHSLELVYVDYLFLELWEEKEENILAVTDHFTQYMQAYCT